MAPNTLPHDQSIVIVSPQKVLKITAPDETRHVLWLTALQFLVDSIKKVDDSNWPDVLAARLASMNSLIDTSIERRRVSTAPSRDNVQHVSHVTDKPLPPTPPVLATRSTVMTPPSVPSFSRHARQPSEGASSNTESQISVQSAAVSRVSSSFKSENLEPHSRPAIEPEPADADEQHHTSAEVPFNELGVDQIESLVDRLGMI